MIQLVKRSISGDADAFLELMEKNSLAMYKVARGILDNDEDAADAMQDTILILVQSGMADVPQKLGETSYYDHILGVIPVSYTHLLMVYLASILQLSKKDHSSLTNEGSS